MDVLTSGKKRICLQVHAAPTLAQLMSAMDFPSLSATACRAYETFFSPSSRMSRACSSCCRGLMFSMEEDSMEVLDTRWCWLPSCPTSSRDILEPRRAKVPSVIQKVLFITQNYKGLINCWVCKIMYNIILSYKNYTKIMKILKLRVL